MSLIFAVVVTVAFAAIAIPHVLCNMIARSHNCKLMEDAAVSNTVISLMFPGLMRDKVLVQLAEAKANSNKDNAAPKVEVLGKCCARDQTYQEINSRCSC